MRATERGVAEVRGVGGPTNQSELGDNIGRGLSLWQEWASTFVAVRPECRSRRERKWVLRGSEESRMKREECAGRSVWQGGRSRR